MDGCVFVTEATWQLSLVVGVPKSTSVAVQPILVTAVMLLGQVIVGGITSPMEINTDAELASAHLPLFATALKYVFEVRVPIVAPVKVFEVTAIVAGAVNSASEDCSQRTTAPTLPLNTKLAGIVPVQISWSEATLPPTDRGSTPTVKEVEFSEAHTPLVTTALKCIVTNKFPVV